MDNKSDESFDESYQKDNETENYVNPVTPTNDNEDDLNQELDQEEFDDDGDVKQLDQIFSEGFAAPVDNEDPFQVESQTASRKNSELGNQAASTQPNRKSNENKNNQVNFSREPKFTLKVDQEQKKKKKKLGMFKGKPFKVLKAARAQSNASEEMMDPEEERLKMLPDCCEFTARRNEAHEIDEGRKDMSSAWFSLAKLTSAQLKHLCFSESLLMVEETGAVIGKYYTTISMSKWNDKPCVCVHSASFGKFSTGLESGTSITSFISYNLKPLQEYVHEWATMNSDTIERKTLIMKEMDTLPCKITLIRNGRVVDNKPFSLGLKERENLVTEGLNLLLQRLLVLEKRTNASMIIQSLSYTGKVVRAKYGELGSGWENVKGKQMKTWGIRRTVYVSEDEERVWDSLYNKTSRLILRCQPDAPQALIPLWFESIIDFDKNGNFIGSYSPYAWACDMELYSKYTVKKEEITYDNRRYILDHPEVRALLSDYLQSILFRKPQNVIEFTKQYFEAFINLRAKSSKSQTRKAAETSQRASSSYYYGGSSLSMLDEGDFGEGEWLGEGEDGDTENFYPVNPKVNYDGLEQVDDNNANTESEMGTTENETEDDLVVNEQGQYVRRSK